MSDSWTWDAYLKAAEACQKGGMAFAMGVGSTPDSVNSTHQVLAAFGAELVDAKGNIQIKSAAMRQALEYCQKLVKFLPDDPAPPSVAVQIFNRGTAPGMLAKLKAG